MNKKAQNIIEFYTLTNTLKDLVRSGYKRWNIERDRVESVAEHTFSTCMLAIAIDSEYNYDIDMNKVLKMLVVHEMEEIFIGDITPVDNVTDEEKHKLGKEAVAKVFKSLMKKEEYQELIIEFDDLSSKEAIFAKMCDKLDAEIQVKLYEEEGALDINKPENEKMMNTKEVISLIETGAELSVFGLFREYDKNHYKGENKEAFIEISKYLSENEILNANSKLTNIR